MAQYVVGMATFTPGTDRNKYGWVTSNGDNISTFFSGGLDAVLPDASLVATNYPGVDTAIVPGGSVLQIDIWPIPSVSMEEGDTECRTWVAMAADENVSEPDILAGLHLCIGTQQISDGTSFIGGKSLEE